MLDHILQSTVSPIGLDIGSSNLRMIQLKRDGTSFRVIASGHYRLPNGLPESGGDRDTAITDGLRQLLDANAFRGRKVVSVVPDMFVQFKNIRMPQMPPAEQRQAVQWEAADRMQLDGDAHKIDYITAGEVRLGEELRDELLLMAVANEQLNHQVELLVEAGLQPIVLEPTPLALARCFSQTVRRQADQNQVRAMVDIGYNHSNVVVFRGRQVSFYKMIDAGGRQLTEAVAERLGLPVDEAADLRRKISRGESQDDAQSGNSARRDSIDRAVFEAIRPIAGELAKEIGLCLRYHSVTFRGARPAELSLLGGEATDPHLARIVAEQLEMEVRVAAPLAGIDLSDDQIAVERRGSQPEWALAAGLALRGFSMRQLEMRGAA